MPKVLFVGNFVPPHSTENELRRAFEAHGWDVDPAAEADVGDGTLTADRVMDSDLVLWVMTQGLVPGDADWLYETAGRRRVPTACFHLDLYYGLSTPKGALGIPRDHCPAKHPMFEAEYAFTADGGHASEFLADDVNHFWLPPAVSHFECIPGTPRPELEADVTFVGSAGGYHPESTHRPALIRFLRSNYGPRFQLIPSGGPALRGQALRDLYASTKVVVGDSCMYGQTPIPRYCSDRIPETLGRGGFLLHPHTPGIFPELWTEGEHLDTWVAGNWEQLAGKIDWWLDSPDWRAQVAEQGRVHTLTRHTYLHRVETMLRTMELW